MPAPGIALMNPYHLRDSARNKWRGEVEDVAENRYERFQSVEASTRAFVVILNHYKKGGKRTFADIFERYAPAADNNDPESYAAFVARKLGKKVTDEPNLRDPDECLRLCQAVIRMECGRQPNKDPWYGDASIAAGISWAHEDIKQWF